MQPMQDTDLPSVFLSIGALHVAQKPTMIWTVLGSCVSIILYHRPSKTGAMCHAQLPEKDWVGQTCRAHCPSPCSNHSSDNDFRFVSCALNHMVSEMNKMGYKTSSLQSVIVGGANMFGITNNGLSVGEKNANKALAIMQQYNLFLVKKDLGGNVGRKVHFNTLTGEIQILLQKPTESYKDLRPKKELH